MFKGQQARHEIVDALLIYCGQHEWEIGVKKDVTYNCLFIGDFVSLSQDNRENDYDYGYSYGYGYNIEKRMVHM